MTNVLTLILGWKAFLEGQIMSGMWTPRTQQKDQIDILEMKETCEPSVRVYKTEEEEYEVFPIDRNLLKSSKDPEN
jgi:hypothetical protein